MDGVEFRQQLGNEFVSLSTFPDYGLFQNRSVCMKFLLHHAKKEKEKEGSCEMEWIPQGQILIGH